MTTKDIAALVAQMEPPFELRNSDAILMWRLEKAAELAVLLILEKTYKGFTHSNRHW